MGIAHGAFCVGCCWSLMLVMFGVGLASLSAMLVLGGLTADREEPAVGAPAHPAARRAPDPGRRLRDRRVSRASYPRRWWTERQPDRGDPSRTPRSGDGRHPRADPRRGPRLPARRRLRQPVDPSRRRRRRASRSARSTTTSGRKLQLILAVLAAENERLLERQRAMFDAPGAAVGPLGARLRLPRHRRRLGLRPDPPGDDRRGLVRRGGRGLGPRDGRRLVPAPGRGRPPRGGAAAPTWAGSRPDEVAALMGDAVPRRRGADPARRHRGRAADALGAAQGRRAPAPDRGNRARRPRRR